MIIAVIGLGTFGAKTATRLFEQGVEVMAIDSNSELVDKIKDRSTHAVCLDVTEERSMRSINISDVDLALVAIGDNIEMSILAVAMLRKLGVGRVIARATNKLHEHVLEQVGASEIIKVEEEMGDIIASRIVSPNILQKYSFALGFSIMELMLGRKFEGKTIVETLLKQKYDLTVVAIHKKVPFITEEGRSAFRLKINDNPKPMDILDHDDTVILTGKDDNFAKLFIDLDK